MTKKAPAFSLANVKRVLIKLSGERLGGDDGEILDVKQIDLLAEEMMLLVKSGYQVAVVLGGGNILRGKEAAAAGIEEAQAHHMGMLATVINALALQSVLEKKGQQTRVMTSMPMENFAEPYIRRRAVRHMEKGRVIVFGGGTGNPFFTTDTAGALRAIEIGADLLVKATKVDGIYTSDPKRDPNAQHIPEITYKSVLVEDLQVMDGSAISLCREHKLPLMVCNVSGNGSVLQAMQGKAKRTIVHA
ncbi:MAG: UMP kinase [Alphaproteobacteria bacterium]